MDNNLLVNGGVKMVEIVATIGVSIGCLIWIWLGFLIIQRAIKWEKGAKKSKMKLR